MRVLLQIRDKIDKFGYYWSIVAILLVILPTLESLIFRSLLNRPTVWSLELSTMIFGIYFMVGGARCEADNGHVAMDLFSSHYKGIVKVVFETINVTVCFLYCGLLFYFGGRWFIDVLISGERSESLWMPLLWPSRLAIPVGAAMLYIRTLITYFEKVHAIFKGGKT